MTVLVVLAMLLAAAQQDALQPVHRAHAALAECAVTVTVEARANSGATRFEYDLWRTGPKRFRVDLRTSGPDAADALERRVVGDGSRVLLYEPATNRYVPGIYAPEGRLIDAVSALMGRVDPFTQVYLDADDGLKRFLAQFGALEFERIADRGGRSVFSASGGEAGAPIVVTVEVNRATNLTSRVLLDAGGGLGATWTVRAAPTSAEEALRFRVPGDARSVTELRDEPPAAVIESDDARKVIERSRKAYDDLNTFSFSSRAFLFPEGPEQKRLANCWWEKGGRLRFAVTLDHPNRSFAVLYDGRTLTGYDRVRKKVYRGTTKRKEMFTALDRMNATLEPLVVALIKGDNYWDRFQSPGARLRLLKETAVIRSVACWVIESRTAESWVALVYVRQKDGLIARIDRRLEVGGKVPYAETVFYTYNVVNSTIPGSAWKLQIPSSLKATSIPSGSGGAYTEAHFPP